MIAYRSPFAVVFCFSLVLYSSLLCGEETQDSDMIVFFNEGESIDGWTAETPREEIAPIYTCFFFSQSEKEDEFVLSTDQRIGLAGCWRKSSLVEGGTWTRFSVERKLVGVALPRRAAFVKLTWSDGEGNAVRLFPRDPASGDIMPGEFVPSVWPPTQDAIEDGASEYARPEYPRTRETDAEGWTLISDTYFIPEDAIRVDVELHLRWEPNVQVRWRNVQFEQVDGPPQRKVRLATIHFRPGGTDAPLDNIDQFDPLLAEAAAMEADLVVLGEVITKVGHTVPVEDLAEPIPGPSTEKLGELALKHGVYIVAGLNEREEHLVYNVAVLIGPDGELIGKYRKVCLPREETLVGIMPGEEYPVFDTPLGKIGMMVCWDVFFPEVARGLANNGAEVIALPIWGGHPALAQARAIENQCYIVTSTYTSGDQWMRSGVLDPTGQWLATAEEQGEVVVVEVDLNKRYYNRFLGDFRGRIPHERP